MAHGAPGSRKQRIGKIEGGNMNMDEMTVEDVEKYYAYGYITVIDGGCLTIKKEEPEWRKERHARG